MIFIFLFSLLILAAAGFIGTQSAWKQILFGKNRDEL